MKINYTFNQEVALQDYKTWKPGDKLVVCDPIDEEDKESLEDGNLIKGDIVTFTNGMGDDMKKYTWLIEIEEYSEFYFSPETFKKITQ